MPELKNELRIYDVNDKPLAGAAVYVYHVPQGPGDADTSISRTGLSSLVKRMTWVIYLSR